MIPKGQPFDAAHDIPELTGKYVLITGGTSGIGRECVLALAARHPAKIMFTGRNRTHASQILDNIRSRFPETLIKFVPLEQSRIASVRCTILELLESGALPRLDILICNAGTMACPPLRTQEGYDIQFATNYLSHALIIQLLLPRLLETRSAHGDQVRIVFQTSEAYMLHPRGGIDWSGIKTNPKGEPKFHFALDRLLPWGGEWMRYGQAQLASLLHTAELARRYPDVLSVAVMPGAMSNTKLIRTRSLANRLLIHTVEPVLPAEKGAQSLIWAAASTRYDILNGGYYQAVAVVGLHVRMSRDRVLAERLWKWTEEELGLNKGKKEERQQLGLKLSE